MSEKTQLQQFVGQMSSMVTDICKMTEDGKIDYSDVPQVISSIKTLMTIGGSDFSKISKEVIDIGQADVALLSQAFAENFDIKNETVEPMIENLMESVFDFSIALKSIVTLSIELKDYVKKE